MAHREEVGAGEGRMEGGGEGEIAEERGISESESTKSVREPETEITASVCARARERWGGGRGLAGGERALPCARDNACMHACIHRHLDDGANFAAQQAVDFLRR